MVAALAEDPRATGLPLEALRVIGFYFLRCARSTNSTTSPGKTWRANPSGARGMMSNLANQLKEQGALDKIHKVFQEIPRSEPIWAFPRWSRPLRKSSGPGRCSASSPTSVTRPLPRK